MTPSTLTAPARRRAPHAPRSSRRQATARRRRRTALAAAVLVAAGIAVVMALPLAKRAVNALGLPLRYPSVIRRQAAEKRLDPALLAGVIYTETKFEPRTSSAGAVGLMQLLPETARFLAHRSGATTFTTADLGTPRVNIAYGAYYLRYLLDEYHNRIVPALAAYNGGETNVDRWAAAAHAAGHPLRISDIPFPETQDYVTRVLQAQRRYRSTYAAQLGYG